MAFSRFQTLYLKKTFPQQEFKLVSYGPCQTPTLGFCVKRYEEVRTFIPQQYFYIQGSVLQNGAKQNLHWEHPRVFSQVSFFTSK